MENSVIDREHDHVASKSEHHKHDEFKYPPLPPQGSNVNLNDFLNPRSMLTPGVAGSLVMLIANTLFVSFAIPQKWSALTLSFLLIIPVLIRFCGSTLENIIYFIFNGLIVFALAVNTNFVGSKLQQISGVVVEASSDTQQINMALKSSLAAATSDTDQTIKKINYMQLASNDVQGQQNTKTDSSPKQTSKNKDEKSKSEDKKNDRAFFGNWF